MVLVKSSQEFYAKNSSTSLVFYCVDALIMHCNEWLSAVDRCILERSSIARIQWSLPIGLWSEWCHVCCVCITHYVVLFFYGYTVCMYRIQETSAGETFVVFTQPQIFSCELWPCQSALLVYRNAAANVFTSNSYFPLKTWKFSLADVFQYTV